MQQKSCEDDGGPNRRWRQLNLVSAKEKVISD